MANLNKVKLVDEETMLNMTISNLPDWDNPSLVMAASQNATEERINTLINDSITSLLNYNIRNGISSVMTLGTVNLSLSRYAIYEFNYNVTLPKLLTSGAINFTNGIPGETIYVKVNSGGSSSYGFGANMKFPSSVAPVPSESGKTDIYSFLCFGSSEYLGSFAFNYS